MGKTFRKDSRNNKYNRRDKDAKQKFSKKFQKHNHSHVNRPAISDVTPPEDY